MLSEPEPLALMNATHDVLAAELGNLSQRIPQQLTHALDENIYLFSGFKTYHQMNDCSRLLKGDDGGFKPFDKFLQDVLAVDAKYNRNYLYAEYNFAVSSTQMAVKWHDIEKDGDDYDLQYRTAGDEKVREEHQALDGTTLPPSDKFWNEYYPPNGWNCRCTAVQVRKGKYPQSDSDKACAEGERATTKIAKNGANKAEMFRFNPGKANKVFPPKHPYFKAPQEAKKKVNAIVATIFLSPRTNKTAFRELQAQARAEVKAKAPFAANGKRYYTRHLYYGNEEKKAVIAHCFTSLEIEAARHLDQILPSLKDGKYQPIDMSRSNYKRKQQMGVLHFTAYQFEYDGHLFELKCEAIRDREDREFVKEHPYSLKEKE